MKTLQGKTVAITGTASGIGRALALDCAGRGSKLAIVDVDEAGLARTAEAARERGATVLAQRLDVSDRAALHAWAARVQAELGGADVLINNAGVSLSHTVERMSDEDFEWLFNINFWGVVNGCKAFLPQLRARTEGHIVNLSSVFGIIGVPTQAAYNAAKFAVRGYSEALRQELRTTGVRVTCVHPGGIKTEIALRGRHYQDASGAPTDTARVAAEFARTARTSPEQAASRIVGAILGEKPRLLIGADAYFIDALARLLPGRYDDVLAAALELRARLMK
jgi:NAD(P)-dependent dehydrogenase (short-subunit alcohol dehydrogenase family)